MVFEKVKNVIMEIMGIPENEILLESHLFDELDADSLDMSQIILELENAYNLDINDDEFSSFETVKDIVDYINN